MVPFGAVYCRLVPFGAGRKRGLVDYWIRGLLKRIEAAVVTGLDGWHRYMVFFDDFKVSWSE